jgi:predicted transposase/invertase (TIGR01784 family)
MKKKTEKIGNRVEAMDFVGKTIVRNKMKPFDELTFSDSFLFGEAMMDETVCKDVLEIILGIEIAKVVILEKEKQESNIPEQKSIRMDIYVEDEENTVYNVEMQVEDKKDTPKRSRYYQGLLDSKLLPAGSKSYNLLNKSFVIFICHFE